ncbi:MAG: DUF87 domain-containing protein [Tepidisphaeraceae bacterium]
MVDGPCGVGTGTGDTPGNMSDDDAQLILGTRQTWDRQVPFALSGPDRDRHTLVLGKSGAGKSTLLRNMIVQDVHAGRGLLLIDPHGDLVRDVLDCVPADRAHEVLHINPAHPTHTVGIDLLHAGMPEQRPLRVAGVVEALKSIYADSWGPRLNQILTCALAALAESQNVSLLALPRMLVNDHYRQRILRAVTDPMVRHFWTVEFAAWEPRFRAEAIAPVLNKIETLLIDPRLRDLFGQVTSRWDARWLMDHHRVVIVDLSKGLLVRRRPTSSGRSSSAASTRRHSVGRICRSTAASRSRCTSTNGVRSLPKVSPTRWRR